MTYYVMWDKSADRRTLNRLLGESPGVSTRGIVRNDIANGGFVLRVYRDEGCFPSLVMTGHMALVRTESELKSRLLGGKTLVDVKFPAVILTYHAQSMQDSPHLRSMSLLLADLMHVDGKPVAVWIKQVKHGQSSVTTCLLKADFRNVLKDKAGETRWHDTEWRGDCPVMLHLPFHPGYMGTVSEYIQKTYL